MQRFSKPFLTRALLVGAAVLLAAPVVAGIALTDPEERTRKLNRPLAELPTLEDATSAPWDALGTVARYAADRSLGVLSSALWLTTFRYEVLRDPGVDNTVRNGSLVFLADHEIGGERIFRAIQKSCADPRADGLAERMMAEAARLAAASGAPERKVGVLMVPTKPVLYADRLPPSVPAAYRQACMTARAETSWIDLWEQDAEAHGYAMTYPLHAFEADRDTPHFYPPENFHTSGAAAHVAAWSLLNRLYPGEYEPGAPGYRLKTGKADMRSIYLRYRQIPLLEPKYGPKRPKRAPMEEAALKKQHPEIPRFQVWRSNEQKLGRRALVVGNSFSLHIGRHVAPAFDETVLVYTNGLKRPGAQRLFAEIIPDLDPGAVIFIHHDAGQKGFGLHRILWGIPGWKN
ncbi:MAG: hypothetical protein AAF183_01095 [Pseudomonadota bacterium]